MVMGITATLLFSFTKLSGTNGIQGDMSGHNTVVNDSVIAKTKGNNPMMVSLDINEICYIEEKEEIDLGFDSALFLPAGFDAFKGMVLNIGDIIYVELEEEPDLGIDTSKYLPKNFDAYKGMEGNAH